MCYCKRNTIPVSSRITSGLAATTGASTLRYTREMCGGEKMERERKFIILANT